MNEQKIYAVEEKISNVSMLLDEIKSNYNEDDLYEDKRSLGQKLKDFKKLVISLEMLHDCQLMIEDFAEDIVESKKKFTETDTHRIETIKTILALNDEDVRKCKTFSHAISEKGGAES